MCIFYFLFFQINASRTDVQEKITLKQCQKGGIKFI